MKSFFIVFYDKKIYEIQLDIPYGCLVILKKPAIDIIIIEIYITYNILSERYQFDCTTGVSIINYKKIQMQYISCYQPHKKKNWYKWFS